MAGTAYHMEALRKTRVIERKNEAMKKLKESIGQKGDASGGQFDTGDTPLVFSEPGHYAQNREFSLYPPPQTQTKKFVRREREDIIRKKTPDSVKKIQRDQVYAILHPCK
ncbi:uncharacterized protein LOC127866724 isoform X4 [Dreissena polymorpha]|uniref:uncharacterized protein LOC127866724 isoform X4 n=1 Tax=Dreissena polymorpha TaxID=45954 RepID=UPI00226516C4|nr:uncharacterized protein LOC127866724 isoform X4 [Dreissena polymorpha]